MAGPRQLEYLDISDFSAGIVKDLDTGMTAAPDGSASIIGTAGCVANPSGGLFPGPKVIYNNTVNSIPTLWGINGYNINNTEADTNSTSEPERFFLNDFTSLPFQRFAFDPTNPFGNVRYKGPSSAWEYSDFTFSAFNYYMPVVGSAGQAATLPVSHFIRHRWTDGSSAISVEPSAVSAQTGVNCYPINVGSVMPAQNQVGGHDSVGSALFVPVNALEMQKFGFPIFWGSYDGAPYYAAGSTILTGTVLSSTLRLNNGVGFLMSPNPQAFSRPYDNWFNESFANEGTQFTVHSAVTHGGRLVALVSPLSNQQRTGYAPQFTHGGGYNRMGEDGDQWTYNNQQLHFSQAGNFLSSWDTGTSAGTNILGLTDHGIGPINAMISMNANQLFMITANRGAITINGDLRNPSVVNLPGVESTYGRTPKPVVTNSGVVYGSKSGLFLWNGSDTSVELSSQLEGNFWNVNTFNSWREFKPMGSMAYRHPFLYAPSDYIHDFRTNSWWRLQPKWAGGVSNEGRNRFCHYTTSARGTILASGVEASVRDQFYGARIDPDQYETSWKWRSQPISISRNRQVNIREIDIVLQGNATSVEVEIYKNGSLSQQRTLTGALNSSYPNTLSLNFDVTGTNLQVAVNVSGGVCKMHRLSIGWRDDALVVGS
jgi:hypothetical protein